MDSRNVDEFDKSILLVIQIFEYALARL